MHHESSNAITGKVWSQILGKVTVSQDLVV